MKNYNQSEGPNSPIQPRSDEDQDLNQIYLEYSSNSIPVQELQNLDDEIFVGRGFYRTIDDYFSESESIPFDAIITGFAFISQFTGILNQPINVLSSLLYCPPQSSAFETVITLNLIGDASGDLDVRIVHSFVSFPIKKGGRLIIRFTGNGISFARQFKNLKFIPTIRLVRSLI